VHHRAILVVGAMVNFLQPQQMGSYSVDNVENDEP
jgi:hypothetical protein